MKNQNPHRHNLAMLNAMAPALSYDGQSSFAAWQASARARLAALLGLPFAACAPDLTIEYEREEGAVIETRFTFQSEAGYYVPCHFLRPRGAAHPLPVVICLQGHSTGMHISLGRPKYAKDAASIADGDRDFARRAAAEGFCALVLEQRNFGECGGTESGPGCFQSSMAALLAGRTTIGERVWDVSRAIDVLAAHFAHADIDRIICLGNSGGGTTTYYAACLDERIAVAVPSCAVCTYDESIAALHHCSCNYIPHLRAYFEMGDLGGLIAPRGLVVVAGEEDPIFPIGGVHKSFETIQRLYKAAGRPEGCALVVGKGGHRFYADDAWPVIHTMLR